MMELVQHPAGVGCSGKKKMLACFVYFIFSTLVGDSISASTNDDYSGAQLRISNYSSGELTSSTSVPDKFSDSKSDRPERSLSQITLPDDIFQKTSLGSDENSEFVQRQPNKYESDFIILYIRPSRTENKEEKITYSGNNEKKNTVIPMPRFGRSGNSYLIKDEDNSLNSGNENSKKRDTLIPGIRFGKRSSTSDENLLNSVIPYPRLGRSLTEKEYMLNENDVEEINQWIKNSENENNDFRFEDEINQEFSELKTERKKRAYKDIIPYPRPGRRNVEDNQGIYISDLKYRRSDSDYVLPQIRYGRSMILLNTPKGKEKISKQKTETFILPYPRPGRSNRQVSKDKSNGKLHVILPYPRPGRSENDKNVNEYIKRQGYMVPNARFGRSNTNSQFESEGDALSSERFLGLKVNPLLLNSDRKNLSEKSKDLIDSSSVFVIPYPRPGKKSTVKSKNHDKNVKNDLADFLLPYPRPGKKSTEELSLKQHENLLDGNEKDTSSLETVFVLHPRLEAYENFVFENEIPGGQYKDIRNQRSDSVLPYPRLGRSNSVVPYPRLGRSDSIVPYPRLGRSDSVVPYPRLGRSDSIVPYPRLGRGDSVVPYPRLGRSESVVPYPRLGRSDSVVPYPRLGRGDSIVPYPRLGRSNSVVPYPRLGRSDTVVPNLRFGRSNVKQQLTSTKSNNYKGELMLPNLRPGRSNSYNEGTYILPYPRPGRSDKGMIIPYPRLGRSTKYGSGYVIPQPRIGRSTLVDESDSGTVIPYPRVGRSQKPDNQPSSINTAHKLSKHMLSKGDESIYLLPYPRPGRFLDDF